MKSIYSFGSAASPGISDLDFVVSVSDGASLPKTISYIHFDKQTSYILSHNPFVFQESIFPHINKISNFGSLKYEMGVKLTELDLPEYDQDFSLFILIDYCNYFYPRIFLSLASENVLDVRLSIQLLNAFTHSICLFRKIVYTKYNNISNEFDDFIFRLWEYKEKFFSLSKEKNLKNLLLLLDEAAIKSYKLVKALDKFINQYYWTNITSNKIIYKRSGYIFINNYSDSLDVVNTMKALRKKFGGWISILPISFAYPVIKYSHEQGYISKLIKNDLVYEPKVPDYIYFVKDLLEKMKVRIDLINRHYEFYVSQKNKVKPVHDYYQMNGLTLTNNQIKLLNKYV